MAAKSRIKIGKSENRKTESEIPQQIATVRNNAATRIPLVLLFLFLYLFALFPRSLEIFRISPELDGPLASAKQIVYLPVIKIPFHRFLRYTRILLIPHLERSLKYHNPIHISENNLHLWGILHDFWSVGNFSVDYLGVGNSSVGDLRLGKFSTCIRRIGRNPTHVYAWENF